MLTFIKILAIVIASSIALLDGFFDFRKKNKVTKLGATALILMIIAALAAITIEYFEQQIKRKDEQRYAQIEKLKSEAELERYSTNIRKIDSITKMLSMAYSEMNKQETINQKHHSENMTNLYHITDSLEGVLNNVRKQSTIEGEFFSKSLDSLSKLTHDVIAISKNVEMENYPLVPIQLWAVIHIKYRNEPFENCSMFLDSQEEIEWFTYENLSKNLYYGFWGFPKFVEKQKVIDEIVKMFTFSIYFKRDSITCIEYPELKGDMIEPTNVSEYVRNYAVSVYNSVRNKELVFYIRYTIPSFRFGVNYCQFSTIKDFENCKVLLNYDFRNPSDNFFVEGYNNHPTDSLFVDEHNRIVETLVLGSHYVKERFILDISNIYLDSMLRVDYGKNLIEYKNIKLISGSTKYTIDKYWLRCEGKYLFK
jgi:hypothetical protein